MLAFHLNSVKNRELIFEKGLINNYGAYNESLTYNPNSCKF